MSDLDLMRVLAAATAALASPDADPGVIDRVLENLPAQAGLDCRMRLAPEGLRVDWQSPPSASQEAFADVLAQAVQLAVAAAGQESPGVLDPAGFAAAVERGVAAARWRGGRVSIAVFDVYGLVLGPSTPSASRRQEPSWRRSCQCKSTSLSFARVHPHAGSRALRGVPVSDQQVGTPKPS